MDKWDNKQSELAVVISGVLRLGVWLSATLVALGLLLGLWRGDLSFDFSSLTQGRSGFCFSAWGSSSSFIEWGVLVMLFTPVVRMIFALIGFIRERDTLYALLSLGVLLLMAIAFALEVSH